MTIRVHRMASLDLDELEAKAKEPSTSEAMADVVDSLPEPYRTVVEGIFWEGVPRRALARRLGVDRPVIERLYREALVRLLEGLDAYTRPPASPPPGSG